MSKLISTGKWFICMWPVLLPVAFAAIHYVVIRNVSIDLSQLNKIISLFLQILGGFIILYSIDSNIGIVNKNNLFSLFISYLKRCPLIQQPGAIMNGNLSSMGAKSYGKMRVGSPTNTVQGRIDYLQEQINWLKEDIDDEFKDLKNAITKKNNEIKESISTLSKKAFKNEQNIKKITVGGIKLQIFGILLMIHGAVSNFFA